MIITHDTFPKQDRRLGDEVEVCFNYDPTNVCKGKIVRMDIEEPGRMIIWLNDGRYVLSTECSWRPLS